jgi:flagellar motility protein MotE (MotC chaperone)
MNKFKQLQQKTAGMGQKVGQLPGVGTSMLFLQRRWVRRILFALGGTGAALIVALIAFGTYGRIRQVYAPGAPPSPLLVESIQQQQEELSVQQAAAQAEKKMLAADQAEMKRALDELAQLELQLERALLAREQTVQAVAGQSAAVADLAHQVARQQELAAVKPDTLELNNIKKVTKILSAMKPAALAGVIKQLREELVLEILLRMEERKVAKLFAVLEPADAARLSTKLNARKAGGRP